MFFSDVIRRKLEALLQPWLRDDPELEFKLGLLRSNGTLNNFSLNTSAFNELLDDPSKFCFKEATVEHLSLQFSPFSSAAFTLVIRGLRIVFSIGELKDERGGNWRRKPKDTIVEERNKVLQEIDPEGCALHGAIKSISGVTTRTWTSSLISSVVRHCQLQLHDIHVLLQPHSSRDPFSCSLYSKKVAVASPIVGGKCFIRRVAGSIFMHSEESLFGVDINNFEIRLKHENHLSSNVHPTNIYALVKLNNLQITNVSFSIPALKFSFAPMDVYVILSLLRLLSKESKSVRPGKHLWSIVARRISSLRSTSKLSFTKVVRIVCLWLRYLDSYRNILVLVGYPAEKIMKRSVALMFQEPRYARSVKLQWRLIGEIENDIPLEAIALARRIIRFRVASSDPGEKDSSHASSNYWLFLKLHQFLVLILTTVRFLLNLIIRILFLDKVFAIVPEGSNCSGSVREDFLLKQNISFNVQEILVSFSPACAAQSSLRGKAISDTAFSQEDLLSFHLFMDAFFLRYMTNITEQCFTFAFGCLKVLTSPVTKVGTSSYFEEQWRKETDRCRSIILVEPAQSIYVPETFHQKACGDIGITSLPNLAGLLEQLWLNWKNSLMKLGGESMRNVQNPWILCEIRNCLKAEGPNSWFWNCSLVVGKVNIFLDYAVLASILVLLRQIQCVLCWSQNMKESVHLRTPIKVQDLQVFDWRSQYVFYSSKIEMEIIRMLPEKHVQIAAFITGPNLQISLSNDQFLVKTTDRHHLVPRVSFEICNIELLISPNLGNTSGSSREETAEHDEEPKCFRLEEPYEIDIPDTIDESYSCMGRISLNACLKVHGLKAYFDKSSVNQKYQVMVLSPTTMQLRCLRKDYHSIGSSTVACSASSCLVAAGFSSLVFLDELHLLTEVILGALYKSFAFAMDGIGSGLSYKEASTEETLCPESMSKRTCSVKDKSLGVNTCFIANSTCELKSMDIILHNSRNNTEDYTTLMSISRETGGKLARDNISDDGIYVSVHSSIMEFIFRGGNLDVVMATAGVQCFIFRYLAEVERSSDNSDLKNVLRSLNFLSEASISHSKLLLALRSFEDDSASTNLPDVVNESSFDRKTLHMVDDFPLIVNNEKLGGYWLFTKIILSEIYITGFQTKELLTIVNKFEKFNASLFVGREFETISCQSKGGSIILEGMVAAMFIETFGSYYHQILELSLAGWSPGNAARSQRSSRGLAVDSHPGLSSLKIQRQEIIRDLLKVFSMSILQLSLILVARDESGELQELLFEVDFQLNFEILNMMRKLSIGVTKFSMLSQFMHGTTEQKFTVIPRHPFSRVMPGDSSSNSLNKDSSPLNLQYKDTIEFGFGDSMGPSRLVSVTCSDIGCSRGTTGYKNSCMSPLNYILKELQCSLAVEGPVKREQSTNAIWVGNGSISGLDMTISLSEIKMMLSTFDYFSEALTSDGTSRAESGHRMADQEAEGSMEEIITDGTIVAIQDVDQHMYIAVEGAESKYDVVGAVHYSLVGERALFRVNYHNSRWKSQARHFFLISLYAKDASGKPLRLNCRSRSRFVEISCSDDSSSAVWTMLPFRSDAYEDGVEQESSSSLSRRNFHLVNKKNDCAVAFIDGILEFVSKPGNLFKWKVFRDSGPAGNVLTSGNVMGRHANPTTDELVSCSRTGTNQQSGTHDSVEEERRKNGNLLGITIAVDKITVTLVHQLSVAEEKFPLVQGSVLPNKALLQISNSKVRFMDTLEVVLYYFDGQRNLWREFIQPLEICTFYFLKFHNQDPENSSPRVSSHFHARIKEITVVVSEHSLDTFLFVIGSLDLAGPYAVNSSVVLANCCKVENQTNLTLLCQFYDNQDASISAREVATIFLRHLSLANQAPEASFFSLQLFQHASLTTTPLRLSLLEARQFAWRTRIMSSQDSKSFPGPCIVVEISRGIQDGLSVVVSPLLRIYNETDFPLDLRFQRPQRDETESALLVLKAGDVVDDATAAFSATDLSGGLRKALTSLSVGNYIFSFRPNIGDMENSKKLSVEWSDDLQGGKPIHLSGIFDKLSYEVRKAFSVDSVKVSLSSANCALKSEDCSVTRIHFLIQTVAKSIPVMNPDDIGRAPGSRNSPVTMQEQKEIFVLPTIRVSNSLHTEIHVNLTDRDPGTTTMDCDNRWRNATIPCGSAVNFYANPATIFFEVTLTSFSSRCKPVNSGDWVRKLQKQKSSIRHFDIELDFSGGKYSAILRLFRGPRGTLEAVIFTSYSLQNDTSIALLCFAANQKPLYGRDIERFGSVVPPDMGSYLPPNSITSWFLKCHKLHFTLLEEKALKAQLDIDALSGLTEIDLETEETSGSINFMRLAVSLRPLVNREVSSQIVRLKSRYVVCNESEEVIAIRQCYTEDIEDFIAINSKKRVSLRLKTVMQSKESSVVENLLRKHIRSQNDSSLFIQFRPYKSGLGWSGPVCVASLGRFFLKFRSPVEYPETQSTNISLEDDLCKFAAVHVVEEGSTIVLHFHRPPITNLPYRIENRLRDAPITYYQKGSSEPEVMGAGSSANYVWDDMTLPHKLVVQLDDVHLLHEINLDKVRKWKPFYRSTQTRGLGFHLPLDKRFEDQKRSTYGQLLGTETVKVGYEIYAEGVTRVLRICERSDGHKLNIIPRSSMKMRLRVSYFAIHLLEHAKQEIDLAEPSDYVPIITAKLERLNWDSMSTGQHKYYQIRLQSLSMDEKWIGAPFSTMLRRHQSEKSDADNYILHFALVLLPAISRVKQVKYLSIVLQPLDLNLDEETLMRIVPFWRRSLSDSSTPRQQYYFDHFEIHPIKIVTTFLPGDMHYSYSSTQETLRSLLHSVIKVPAIKSKTVELNGVLVTHALITLRELSIKCAQHYSWYTMRAVYIAKGSPLLPPAFASVFDDLASSSLDVFFDPSSGLLNLPGVTLGTLKLISKFIDNKGFSGTKRYFGDLGKTFKKAGSNMLFAAVTEISDSILKGAEASGFDGMVNGFHQGILKLAMEPSVLGSAVMEGGPDRKIKLDRSPGVDELYIEGYLQAMLDTMYKQEYLRVRVVENQVVLKNLPPSSSLIDEIMERVKDYLASKALLKGRSSSHSLQHIRGEREWKIGPTVLTLCEHLFVSFAIQILRKHTGKAMAKIPWKIKEQRDDDERAIVPSTEGGQSKMKFVWKWGIGRFVLSGIVAYVDGRLCRHIPHPLARRIVSGFLLSFLDKSDDETKQ